METVSKTIQNLFHSNKIIRNLVFVKVMKKLGLRKLHLISIDIKRVKNIEFKNLIDISRIEASKQDIKDLEYLVDKYSNHYFDILGSGWISTDLDLEASSLDSNKNREYQEKELKRKYIDWNKDFKSGFKFNKSTISERIREKIPKGVDIKVPWELSRMYHFPQMAILASLKKEIRIQIITEFKDQLFSFYTQNKIGFGANYVNAMEVAIRCINILISYDIFKQLDDENILNVEFDSFITERIIRDGRFIINNLEMNLDSGKNGNHYLANLLGLLYIGSYISSKETEDWYLFAQEQFITEVFKQFAHDGSLYECSTAYHRLSSEMVIFALAIFARRNRFIDNKLKTKLDKIIDFLLLTRKNDGTLIQVGDNDSGRIVKVIPRGKYVKEKEIINYNIDALRVPNINNRSQMVFVENQLILDNIVSYYLALIDKKATEFDIAKCYLLEYSFIKALICDMYLKNEKLLDHENVNYFFEKNILLKDFKYKKAIHIKIPKSNFNLKVAPDFGLYQFFSERVKLFIRTNYDYNNKLLAHAHDDILHFELYIDEKSFFSDAGSYTYTPSLEMRNEFRGSSYHNIPQHEKKMVEFSGFFNFSTDYKGEIIVLNRNELGILLEFGDVRHYRNFKLTEELIIVKDQSTHRFEYPKPSEYFSFGYGMRSKRKDEIEVIYLED